MFDFSDHRHSQHNHPFDLENDFSASPLNTELISGKPLNAGQMKDIRTLPSIPPDTFLPSLCSLRSHYFVKKRGDLKLPLAISGSRGWGWSCLFITFPGSLHFPAGWPSPARGRQASVHVLFHVLFFLATTVKLLRGHAHDD